MLKLQPCIREIIAVFTATERTPARGHFFKSYNVYSKINENKTSNSYTMDDNLQNMLGFEPETFGSILKPYSLSIN